MGKRIGMIVLLVLLVAAAILQNSYVENITPTFLEMLDKVEESLEKEDFEQAIEDIDAFVDLWMAHRHTYEALFEHDEVDEISAIAESIRSFCITEEKPHALADIEAIKFLIHHINTIDEVRWFNIL